MYGVFARHYDRLMQNAAYEERAGRVGAVLSAHRIAKGEILDLACGTGTVTLLLTRRGYELIAVDRSQDMLAIAQQKCEAAGLRPLLLCQDMRALDLYGTVDAAVCLLDSLNHLPDREAVRAVFARLSLFLRPGGVLIFDVNTPYKHREILANNTFIYELDELFCVWQNAYIPQGDTVEITLDFFERENGIYRRRTERFREQALPPEDYAPLLEATGFRLEAMYDDISEKPAHAQTERAMIVAVRI